MSHIIDQKEKFDPYDINPSVIVIDEYDEVMQNPNISKQIHKILRKYASFSDENIMAKINMNR